MQDTEAGESHCDRTSDRSKWRGRCAGEPRCTTASGGARTSSVGRRCGEGAVRFRLAVWSS
eukprot:1747374-Lingulodinium_polyedra.AAC.1